MEKEIKNDDLNDSLNEPSRANNINMHNEENINSISKSPKFNSDNNINNSNENNLEERKLLNDNNDLNKNYTSINNTENIFKKINNKKVNTTLNDIYGAISNINEVNKRVKSLISKRPNINKYENNKRKISSQGKNNINVKNIPNKINPSKKENNTNNKQNIIKKYGIKDINNTPKNFDNIAPKTTKNNHKSNINNDDNFTNEKPQLFSEQKKQRNNSYIIPYPKKSSKNSKNTSLITNSYSKPKKSQNLNDTYGYADYNNIEHIPNNNIKALYIDNNSNIKKYYKYKEIINSKYNDDYIEDNEKISNNNSNLMSVRSSIITNINSSSIYIDDDLKNEKDIKNIKMKLKK